jgi:hypothetical protein
MGEVLLVSFSLRVGNVVVLHDPQVSGELGEIIHVGSLGRLWGHEMFYRSMFNISTLFTIAKIGSKMCWEKQFGGRSSSQ